MAKDQLILQLNHSTSSVLKIGFGFQGVIMLLAGGGYFLFGIYMCIMNPVLGLLTLGAGVLLLLISKNYLNNLTHQEEIIVDDDFLKIKINNKEYSFLLKDIKRFEHVGSIQYTDHPMNNEIVDFTGLNTTERELQYLIDDGTIEIETEDEKFRFGKNMTSWDTEELILKIEQYTGLSFINTSSEETNETLD